jgi:hypothetical protein
LRGGTRLLGAEVLLQGLILEAAHATEEIDLVGTQADGRGKYAFRQRQPGRRNDGGQPLPRGRTVGIDRRKEGGALDPEFRARLLDVEHGDAQIEVIRERQGD